MLGFRIDPQEKLKATLQEIHNLFRVLNNNTNPHNRVSVQVFSVHPIFGVEYETENLVLQKFSFYCTLHKSLDPLL